MKKHKHEWAMIAALVKTRTPSQVRSHSQKYFVKLQNDKEKIGYQKIDPREDRNKSKTRSTSSKSSSLLKTRHQVRSSSRKEKNKKIHKESPTKSKQSTAMKPESPQVEIK